jgi:predicted membrane-bound mannosyltransferase/streptogramin lyase
MPRNRVEAQEWVLAHLDIIILVGLIVTAAVLRFWDVGGRALHHDESLHAQFSWYLYDGRGFTHDPMMHGPFQFHATAVVYFLFGATDFTARIVPALFGIALVAMPWFLRKQIGMKAVIIATLFLAFSPTLLYFSRFARNDIYIAVWTFAIFICVWRYLDEQKPLYLYLMAFFLALGFATKAVMFITVAIFLLFINALLAIELGRRREGEEISDSRVILRTLAIMPFAFAIAAFWPLISRRPFGRDALPPIGAVMVILGTLSLPQFAAAIQAVPVSVGEQFASLVNWIPVLGASLADTATRVFAGNHGYRVAAEDDMRIITVLVLLVVTAYIGLLWNPRVWLLAAAAFYLPFILLYTTFFTNTAAPWTSDFWASQSGFWSGIWGQLDYWLEQHGVRRGDQPHYYYALLTPLYEFLPLLITMAGAFWVILKGNAFRRWLLFWLAGFFIGLSIAGEKMPWLEVHIALPLVLCAAVILAAAVDRLGFSTENVSRPITVAGAGVVGVMLLVVGDSTASSLIGWLLVGLVLGAIGAAYGRYGVQDAGRVALTAAVAVLLALTVRASTMASFQHGDIPVEMLVYTQTSPDIPRIRDRIDAVARETGLGYNLPLVVDHTDGFSWPWAWYLRDYTSVQYAAVTPDYQPPEGAILLVSRANAVRLQLPGYTQTEYKHRWWFNETYRGLTLSSVVSTLTNWDGLRGLGDFFLYRRSTDYTGSVDAVAFFPEAYGDPAVSGRPAPEPATLQDGRINIGALGTGLGQLRRPAGVFVDGEGNIWVADSGNNRLQTFDAAGNHVRVIRGTAENMLLLGEPWSLAVDAQGFVYIADTWNHRIVKLGPNLQPVTEWGVPGGRPNPGPFDLFGPRDIAISADGSLWVTDTGHKRILHFSASGEALGSYGAAGSGAGEFEEPVGLVFDSQGDLFVADTWNGRIQKFGPGFTPLAQFEVGWTSRDVTAKPYIAVLTDGRIVVTDPANRSLLLFSADGSRIGAWRPEEESYPVGVAAMPDGGFVFSELNRGHLQIVPGSLIDGLFR